MSNIKNISKTLCAVKYEIRVPNMTKYHQTSLVNQMDKVRD